MSPDSPTSSTLAAEVDRVSLLSIIAVATRVISPKSQNPTLHGVMITVCDSILTASATDNDLYMESKIACTSTSNGNALVSGKLFHDILKALPGESVSLSISKGKLQIKGKGKKARYSLALLSVDDFPDPTPMPVNVTTVHADAATLAHGLKQVARHTGDGRKEVELGGVLLVYENTQLRLVATDKYRLAVRDLEIENANSTGKVTAPNRFIAEVTRQLSDAKSVTIIISDNRIQAVIDNVTFTSRLIEKPFPGYQRIIPESYHNELVVDKDEMLAIVRRLALLVAELTPVKLYLSDEGVRATTIEKGVGDGDEIFETATYSGDEVVVAYNPKLLWDCVDGCDGERIVIRNLHNSAPALIRGEEHDEAMFICTPIRISGN